MNMREFKFRAWDGKNFFYFDFPDHLYKITDSNGDFCRGYTLQQFTGLKDKNGKDVYEGDITYHYNHKVYCEIVWSDKWSCFYGKPLDKKDVNSYFYQSLDTPFLGIVGNIHQNKLEEYKNFIDNE